MRLNLAQLLRSKLARRLMCLFALSVAAPLIVTAVSMERFGREQIVWTARTMEAINQTAVKDTGRRFQTLGSEAVRQSSEQTTTTSVGAINAVSAKLAALQSQSLAQTTKSLSKLTSSGFDGAIKQSVATHHATLSSIRTHVTNLVLRSAEATQQQAAGNIERAMLALNATLMQQRAHELAAEFADHLLDAPMFLQFTAQMPDMRDGNRAGQKATLDALVRRLPVFLSVAALDKSGQETARAASDSLVTSADLGKHGDEPYFQQALKGDTYMALAPEQHNSAPVLRFAVPIEAYRGKIVGVIAARFSLESLWETIRAARIGKAGFAYVQDAGGKPVLAPRSEGKNLLTASADVDSMKWRVLVSIPRAEAMQPIEALKRDIARNAHDATVQMQRDILDAAHRADTHLQAASLAVRDKSLKQLRARFAQAMQDVENTTSHHTKTEMARMQHTIQEQTRATQQHTDLRMTWEGDAASSQLSANIQPLTEKALNRADTRLSLTALVIMVTFCLLGCLLALVTAGRIVQPVLKLVTATQSLANGELEQRVDEQAPDEIGDLAKAFNSMAARLQQSRSELNEAEAQLVQSAKLASLGTLSAGVAHELNQPVAIIRGLAQQLQGEPDLHPDVLEDLKLIEGQTSRMTKIIKHLRTFCRVGGEERERASIHDILDNCFMFVGAQLQAHNITTSTEYSDVAPCVIADANELEQVFLNLITNARDAMEGRDDAHITIRTKTTDTSVLIEFEDNGTGIPEAIAAHIFDPFFTTKEPGKGTGLGLSISHNILKKHGGDIRVANTPGACFTITLPLAQAEATGGASWAEALLADEQAYGPDVSQEITAVRELPKAA